MQTGKKEVERASCQFDNSQNELDWLQEEVSHGMQEWKGVERLEEGVKSQEEKEKNVEQLQTMLAVVASLIKSQQNDFDQKKRNKHYENCTVLVGNAAGDIAHNRSGKKRKRCSDGMNGSKRISIKQRRRIVTRKKNRRWTRMR